MHLALNWLWQGLAITLAAAALLAITPLSARRRYQVLWLALGLVLVMPVLPRLTMPMPGRGLTGVPIQGVPAPGSTTSAVAHDALSNAMVTLPDGWWTSRPVAIGMWGGWAAVHMCWLASALMALARARRRCRQIPGDLEARLELWPRLRSAGRPARLAISNGVQAAAVLGGRTPIVALSPTLVDELAPEEIDSVVAHEWSHVQRRDDLAALLQAIVRVAAGWHPAVWWLNRQISLEREHACDETVVELTGAAKGYAACLVKLAGLSMQPVRPLPVVAMSAAGLRPRVVRILAPRTRGFSARHRWMSVAAAIVLTALATSIATIRLIEAAAPDVVAEMPAIASIVVPAPVLVATSAARPPAKSYDPLPASPKMRVTPSQNGRPAAAAGSAHTRTMPAAPPDNRLIDARLETQLPSATAEVQEHMTARTIALVTDDAPPLREGVTPGAPAQVPPLAATDQPTVWGAAADAGVAIGRGSKRGAVATAGFFSRVSKKIASSF